MHVGNRGFRGTAAVAVVVGVANSCGTAAPTSPTATEPHTVAQTIMILEGRPVPQELTVTVGERVSFMNHDLTMYTIAGSQPSSVNCPELNSLGVLASGDVRTTEPFTSAKTCQFDVSANVSGLQTGRIVIR